MKSAASVHNYLDDYEVGQVLVELDDKEPEEVISWALGRFPGDRLAISTSFQADGMVILDMAARLYPNVRVLTVDTGRLPSQTYDLIERVRDKYSLAVELYYPDATELSAFALQHGPNAFYQSMALRLECCAIRKVNPLQSALRGLDAWITGLRRDQSAIRSDVRKIEIDHDHGRLLKINPLSDWTDEEVWQYIRVHDVPYNALYDQGYTSIGCAPCTHPVAAGHDARSGRWWWETNTAKECGIHYRIDSSGSVCRVVAVRGAQAEPRRSGEDPLPGMTV